MWVLLIVAPLLGALLGLFNGALVVGLRLPALVVTLGTLALYRGLAQVFIGESTVGGLPAWFTGIQRREVAGFDVTLFVVFCAVAAVAGITLRYTTFGRKVYAIGTNESAARYSGIATGRVKLAVFMLSGIAMGVAAVVSAMVNGNISYKYFRADELTAITAVVLGGTSIHGGRGGILGTVLAVLLVVAVQSAMTMNYVRPENRLAVLGTLLIGSVVVNDLIGRFRRRS
jgi:rhamnose transport system permease protein